MAQTKEQHRKYELNRYYERREYMIEILGGVCANCSANSNLEFDHIDAKKKNFPISEFWSISYEKLLEELKLCQLLCHRCHLVKTKLNGETGGGHNKIENPKHGTVHMYTQYNCKCLNCKYAKSLYRRGDITYNFVVSAPPEYKGRRGRPY